MTDAACHQHDLVVMHRPGHTDVVGRLLIRTPAGVPYQGGPFVHDWKPTSRADTGLRPIGTNTVHHLTIRPCHCKPVAPPPRP